MTRVNQQVMKNGRLRPPLWGSYLAKQGEQQGLQQGESVLVLRQLTKRFGEIEFSMREKIKKLPTTELEILGESLLDFSQLQDLIDWLGVH
ncbi:MAG: DUF4351 domain-containing protein [Aphanizomenon sp.]